MELNPAGLAQLYNLPVEAVPAGMQLQEQLSQGNALRNEASGIKNLYDTQNNPGLVRQTQLENASKEARLPGELATSRSLGLKADREAAGQQDAISAARMKFIKEASDHDISMLENKAQQMAYSPDPRIRAQGEQLLTMHRDIVKEKSKEGYKADRMIQQIRATGEVQKELEGMRIGAGKYNRSKGATGVQGIRDALMSGKVGYEKAATAMFAAAQEAYRNGDVETGDQYMAEANQYNSQYIAGRQAGVAAGQEGKPDIGKMTEGAIPTRPAPQVNPFTPPQGSNPAATIAKDIAEGAQFSSPAVEAQVRARANLPKQSLQQVQQMYPGVPPEKLKEAYKRKFGVDLQ